VDANPFFTQLTRYQKSEVTGKQFGDLDVFLESEEARRLMQDTRLNGSANFDSVRIRARDGKELILAIVANRYRLKEQDFIQINIRAVTERRKIEARLRRTNLDLQQFAFAASHDLQEPLRTVTTFSQLIKLQHKGELGSETDQHLDFIAAAAERMSHMVLDLLGYSQVVRADANVVPVSVEAVLASVMLNLQLAIRDSGAKIAFDHLPTVNMDQTLLMQLLQNLIGNAIKYRSAAAPEIHLSARDDGSEWVVSVKDNGIGLDPKHAEHIFTVFKRLHGTEYPGTGIGGAPWRAYLGRVSARTRLNVLLHGSETSASRRLTNSVELINAPRLLSDCPGGR
jgi:PAS domain S-box-containing protein